MSYEPESYWRSLHAGTSDLRSVGYSTLPIAFNAALYANAAEAVRRALRRTGVSTLNASVLDVGSGTGFWVDFWKSQGAAHVAGVDLVPAAVDRLQVQFPDSEFVVADLSSGPPFPERRFDVVSAMGVLLHIVDEEGFANAVESLAAQLEPSGALVLLEPFVVHERWSTRGSEGTHNTARSFTEWERVLGATDLRIVHIEPAVFLLSDPVEGRSRGTFALNRLWWRAFAHAVRGRESLASVVMPPLAAFDRALTRLAKTGPSSKCVVLSRR